eukprot:10893607-Alexandrium_andersonii.AAC.1
MLQHLAVLARLGNPGCKQRQVGGQEPQHRMGQRAFVGPGQDAGADRGTAFGRQRHAGTPQR